MITYLKHAEIDKQKWDTCILNAANGLIYAQANYLDAMSPGWDAMVIGDYEAVMPVTWRKKWGIKYICQPAFSQQLGLFYSNEQLKSQLPAMLTALGKKFRLIEIFINQSIKDSAATHTNFVLSLADSYETLSGLYKNDLVKNLNRSKKFNLQYKSTVNFDNAIDVYYQHYGDRMQTPKAYYEKFAALCIQLSTKEQAIVREVSLPNGELLAIGVFLKDGRRLYNIASTTLPNGRMMEANHVLLDSLIKEFAGSGLLLDFEGSDLPGVARFYQKFGPENQPYFFWKINRLPAILKWWKS